jgi:ribosomal protein S12 methylthiotransferase accessory factor
MDIELSFPGGKRVVAQLGGHRIETDQPVELGGQDTAPAPFDLFLASIATCAGIYALGFLQARGLSTEGLGLRQQVELDPVTHVLRSVRLELTLPPDCPEKYRAAVLRAVESCKVKKTIAAMPSFEVILGGEAERAVHV